MYFLFYLRTLSVIRSDVIPYALGSRKDLNSENSGQYFEEESLFVKYADVQGKMSSFCGLFDNIKNSNINTAAHIYWHVLCASHYAKHLVKL